MDYGSYYELKVLPTGEKCRYEKSREKYSNEPFKRKLLKFNRMINKQFREANALMTIK